MARSTLNDTLIKISVLAVGVYARAEENRLGPERPGAGRRHGGVNAKAAGLMAAGRHNSPAGRIAADDDGLTSQLGLVPLLHRRKEGIHVYMDDLAEFSTTIRRWVRQSTTPRLSKIYQETPGEREKGQGKVWERVEQAVTMLADHRRKAVDCKDVVGGKV